MKKIKKIHHFIDINMGKLILFTAVIFFISILAVDLSTDLIIDHDSEKIYNRIESIVEKNKEEIIALSKYDRSEIQAGDDITIIVKQQNITVYDTIYSQHYIVDNNSLKKEGESMYLSIYAISCCFAIFLAIPFFSSVILYFIIYLIVLIIIKISKRIKLYRLTR
jgi:hypothetical protein